MARDLTVTLEDRPGALADMGDALGRAGVNINGISGTAGSGEVHILIDDADAARAALASAGIQVGADAEVVKVAFEDRPGELGKSDDESPTPGPTSRSSISPATGNSCWRRVTTPPLRRLHRSGWFRVGISPVTSGMLPAIEERRDERD